MSRCGGCHALSVLLDGLCHGCRVHNGYYNDEEA